MAYLTRLRGPVIDRFAVAAFTDKWSKEHETTLDEIREKIDRATQFRFNRGQEVLNSRLSETEVLTYLSDFQRTQLLPKIEMSKRRMLSLLRVARTLADLDCKEKIENKHIDQASELCVESFFALSRASSQ